MGFPFKAEDFNEINIGKPAIRIRDIPLSWTRTHTTQEVSEEYIVEQGDILIGMDGFFYLDIWRGQKGYLVQRVCRIRAKEQNLQGFLLESLRQPISYYEKTISGATVAHLGAKHLKEIFINVPKDNELLEELKVFNRLNFQKINLSNQNQKLKEARDILLPRLMNRTIEV
jgi:type I restriction enzyme S subunit